MAFVRKGTDEENQPMGGGGGGILGGGGPQEQQKPTGSGYVDLRQYLDANKNQALQTGQTVANTIQDKGNSLQADVTKFGQKLDMPAGVPVMRPVIGNEKPIVPKEPKEGPLSNPINPSTPPQGLLSSLTPEQTLIQKATNSPETLTPEEVSKFQSLYRGEYKGPNALSEMGGFADLQKKADDLKKTASLPDSEEGRFQLLQGLGDNRTTGQNLLDQYLISADTGARDAVSGAAKGLTGATTGYDALQSRFIPYLEGQKKAATDLGTDTKNKFTGPTEFTDAQRTAARETALQSGWDRSKEFLQRTNPSLTYDAWKNTMLRTQPENWDINKFQPTNTSIYGTLESTLAAQRDAGLKDLYNKDQAAWRSGAYGGDATMPSFENWVASKENIPGFRTSDFATQEQMAREQALNNLLKGLI